MQITSDQQAAFIRAACVPLGGADHRSGTLDAANAMLTEHPGLATASIYTAAVLGNEAAVKEFLSRQPALATAKAAPHQWDALTYLCFSQYLRLAPERHNSLVACAAALLAHGADVNAGWFDESHQPTPEWEPLLYGAAGIAHNAPLTRLLLRHGADPNDWETVYHAPETYDNQAMIALVETGRLTDDSINAMLLRKADWHDQAGIRYLLDAGANPNHLTIWGRTPLQQAVLRDNHLNSIRAMMEHGGNPLINDRNGHSAVFMAAHRGRGDVLRLFMEHGVPFEWDGAAALMAACAMGDAAQANALLREHPAFLEVLKMHEGTLLAEFSGNGNADGLNLLLDLGLQVNAPYTWGDGYFGIAARSSALHVAAWRARHPLVELLIQRGAAVNARDAQGRTPLQMAILACTDSYWQDLRSPQSVQALLAAGATTDGVRYPTGYEAIDVLLAPHCR